MQAQEELQRKSVEQHQAYEDLFHQIKTPISTGFETIRSTLEGNATVENYRSGLETLRPQIRRAKRIARAVGIFAELARKQAIEAHPNLRLQHPAFYRTVIEMADDYERMQERYRELRFVVDSRGFEALRRTDVFVDEDLVLHALGNILDNAGKYSLPGTKVRVFAGITGGTSRFHVSVANRGIRVLPQELGQLKERGFRGEDAVSVTGEGSGIGLWLTDQIMLAHSGELIVVPANADAETEMKLVFPAQKVPTHASATSSDH
jgi:two-component system sensor histidine kinase SenX3